jgi:hypothetical protein
MTNVVRDYGSPVSLEGAECQFAVLDGEDGAPVAYVYSREDALRYVASADLLEALKGSIPALEHDWEDAQEFSDLVWKARAWAALKSARAAIARASSPVEGDAQ